MWLALEAPRHAGFSLALPPCPTHTNTPPSTPLQVLAMVFTFGSADAGVQALVLIGLCVLFIVVHGVAKPMRAGETDTLQVFFRAHPPHRTS